MQIVYAILILAGLGFLFGLILAIFAVKFKVKEDERIEEVTKLLPNYNCGSCGYAGCRSLAEAIISGKEFKVSKCKPGKAETNFDPIIKYLEEHPNEDGSKVKVEK